MTVRQIEVTKVVVSWRLVADRRGRAAARARRWALVAAVATAVAVGLLTMPGQALSWLMAGVSLSILGCEVACAGVRGHRAGLARLRAAAERPSTGAPVACDLRGGRCAA